MSLKKIRRLRNPFNTVFGNIPEVPQKEDCEYMKNPPKPASNDSDLLDEMLPLIISFYADFEDNRYYEGFAKELIKKCKEFGVSYDISEAQSRGSYSANCLMKPEFILDKLKEHKKPILWMDCDTQFRLPFSDFNNVESDIGMATHSGNMEGIKASPLYFNYTEGAFRIIREWVVHCRACYAKGIIELDHDALKHYVLRVLSGNYSAFLLSENWNDFVQGKYINNGNSRVTGKQQVHRQVGVDDSIREKYSQDVKRYKLFFEDNSESSFESALQFLETFSGYSRVEFIFDGSLEKMAKTPAFEKLTIESGGSVYFSNQDFDSTFTGPNRISLEIKGVNGIEKDWDLKIEKEIESGNNPLHSLNFYDNGLGKIRIKTKGKIWI
jgi:hypothetical protein